MAVPLGIPVEQSINEIDAEIRMEDIRQSPAARLKMEHFHASIKRNLMNKNLNYEAEHRKSILEGLKHMKRRLPADPAASFVKRLENLSLNLECLHQEENGTFLMKNDDLTLTIKYSNDKAVQSRVIYFGKEFPMDNEITRRINNNEWEELRILIHSMVRIIPPLVKKETRQQLALYRLSVEEELRKLWNGGPTATISQVNDSRIGWPSPGTSLRPQRIFIYGEPGMEMEMRKNGNGNIDPEKDDIPYAEIVMIGSTTENTFELGDMCSLSCKASMVLRLSCPWLLSSSTITTLAALNATPSAIIQHTHLFPFIANIAHADKDIDLVGHELGRGMRYVMREEWIRENKAVIVEGLMIGEPKNLEAVLVALHQQAVFNSSWESVVASCCGKSPISSTFVLFEMVARGCKWEISFSGNGRLFKLHLEPKKGSRQWDVTLYSSHSNNLPSIAKEIDNAFNTTWSLSKCLSHLLSLLSISGITMIPSSSMDTSLPHSDCSLLYSSKVATAWAKKWTIAPPPPSKHEFKADLPKGRCPLLRMMREVPRVPPLKVARPRPQLSNPTVPPLRVNRMEAGLPLLQSHVTQTPFNHMEKMVRSVEDSAHHHHPSPSPAPPPSTMDQSPSASQHMYMSSPHPGYGIPTMGGTPMRMGASIPTAPSPLARQVGGAGPVPVPAQAGYGMSIQQQHEYVRQQLLMRQQSNASMTGGSSGVFDFPEDIASSPSPLESSPGYGYPPTRGAATGKGSRRGRGRKAGNVGDRTPGSSIDSSPSPFSPENKRPKSGPGSRGGRGSRGKRGITMDQGMSPFQRSISEMSNPSPLMPSPAAAAAAAATPLYQHSFDDGTSDEECDPPPFSRSLTTTVNTPSTTVIAPSPLSTQSISSPAHPTSTPSHTITQSPLASLSSPSPSLPPPPSSSHPLLPSPLTSSTSLPPSTSTLLPPSSSTPSSSSINPSLVRRKSSLESIVGQLSQSETKKKAVQDLFDTGLESSPPISPKITVQTTAPVLYAEPKLESPKKEGGEEKIVLKLKTKSTSSSVIEGSKEGKKEKKKEKEKEKEEKKERKREEKSGKSGEERERKRKGDSSSKEKKDKEAKKAKTTDPPIVGGGAESFVPKMTMLKGFKIPKNTSKAGPSDISIPSSSSSLAPPLPSPSLSKPPSIPFNQSKGGSQPSNPPFRGERGPKGGSSSSQGRQSSSSRAPKSILKGTGGPPPLPAGPPPSRHQGPPERKASHPPYHEPQRTRQPSGGYPPPPSLPSQRRPPPPPPSHPSAWVPLSRMEAPPTLIPSIPPPPPPIPSSRPDLPPILDPPPPPQRSIIDDSPASPDGLQIVDE